MPMPSPLPETRAERRRRERLVPSSQKLREIVLQYGVLAMGCEIAVATLHDMMEEECQPPVRRREGQA